MARLLFHIWARNEIMKRIIAISALCALMAMPLSAQETASPEAVPEGKAMTLRECMEYAVTHSADVRTRQSANDDARLERRDAILKAFTPVIEGNSYGYYRWGRSIDPETNTYVTTTSFNQGFSVSAGLTLFDGFSAINNMKIARTSMAMGKSMEQMEKDKVCLATMEAYFNVIYYSRLAAILSGQVENAETAVELAVRQEELGVKGHADVVQIQAELADREYELTAAVNARENALTTLEDVMFWPSDWKLAVDTDLDALHGGDTPQNATSDLIGNAQRTLPSVLVAKYAMENSLAAIRAARGQFLPSLSLYGGWSTSYYTYPGQAGYTPIPYWNQFSNNGGEYVQLSLNIPIYDRLGRHSVLARKRNEYARAVISYDKSLKDVETEVRRAVQDRDGAEAALAQARKREEVYEEAFRLDVRRFGQGLISAIEYNMSSGNYLKAKADRLNAELQFLLKKRVVAYYGGIPYMEQ